MLFRSAKGHSFDPARFMPVIDALTEMGKKQDADMLSEKMMEMADRNDGNVAVSGVVTPKSGKHEHGKYPESDWHALLHRYYHDRFSCSSFGTIFSSLLVASFP